VALKGGARRNDDTNAEITALQQFGRLLLDSEQDFEDQVVEEQPEGVFKGCRTAIEIMTRQPSKGTLCGLRTAIPLSDDFPASYDVNKGGSPVAILTLPKTIFRLGESVHGTIEINCFEGVPISVLKVRLAPNLLVGLLDRPSGPHGRCPFPGMSCLEGVPNGSIGGSDI
jgi:hypothetical protein